MDIKKLIQNAWPITEAISLALLHFVVIIGCTILISLVFGYLPCNTFPEGNYPNCIQKQFGVLLFLYFTTMIAVFYKEKP